MTGVRRARVRSWAGMAGARSALGSAGVCHPQDPTNRIFKGLVMSYYRRLGQTSLFSVCAGICYPDVWADPKSGSTLWAFIIHTTPEVEFVWYWLLQKAWSKDLSVCRCLLSRPCIVYTSSKLGVLDCRVQNSRILFSGLPRGLGMGYYPVQNLTA